MKPAVIVVDMIVANLTDKNEEAIKIVEPLKSFLKIMREGNFPVVFACDSFLEEDFIFKGKLKKHAIRGTEEVKPFPGLGIEKTDIILEKRRFSAFFKTDLDQTLRTLGVDTVLVCGINTHFCVLATAFDAVCLDFFTIILEDLSAAYKKEIHRTVIELYRFTAMYPLLRVMKSDEFLKELKDS
ncbi:MAG: cysteine hydrolase [Desulfobacterota bacterium]|nr:cysteine hydrolase [Thermodesulfobacteriota bacterium]MDW8002694.1 isochorismatase family cysteine hydrolase [Deltaproteobacteria bacterium]